MRGGIGGMVVAGRQAAKGPRFAQAERSRVWLSIPSASSTG